MIIVKLKGGLGNQMFQYAFGRELQRRNGGELILDLTWLLDRFPRDGVVFRDYDLDIFDLRPRLTPLSVVAQRWPVPVLWKYASVHLSRLYHHLGVRRLVCEASPPLPAEQLLELKQDLQLDGHWLNPSYFEGSEAALRQEFRVRRPLLSASEEIAAKIDQTDSICLDVRRTDYVTIPAASAMHGVLGKDYYHRGIALLAPRLARPHIFVTSDDIDWCKSNLQFDYPTVFLGPEHAGYKFGNKLTLMSRCKHFLISNSTFAWWAAWLCPSAAKTVICPKKWFRDPNMDSSTIIPAGWIRL